MKAAVLYEYGEPLVVEEVELDPPRSGEVRVKITAAGICRSDLHFMKGEARIILPTVLGHEGSGIVQEVGEGVTTVAPGDHVILSFAPNCGRCFFCTSGRPNLCDAHAATGPYLYDGTTRLHKGDQAITHMGKVACFAQEAVVPEAGCVPIAKDFPPAQAALIGCCVTTGVGAVIINARVEPGSTVAVVGCGGVGLNVVQGARLAGAGQVIAVDINEAALEFSGRFGATHTLNPRSVEDPRKALRELTSGRGPDYCFEAYGSAETVELAYSAVRKGGTVVIVGLAPRDDRASLDPVALVRDEKTLKGSYYGSARPSLDFPRMADLYRQGKIDIDGLVTRHYSLDEINHAYEVLAAGGIGRGIIDRF